MTRDEWQRAEPVLTHARLLPDREREALLQTVDLEDALRRDIMEMFRRSPAGSASLAAVGHVPTPPASAHTTLPSLPALAPGSSLANGRYVVVRQIGRGGMGAVFLGHDTMFGTLVALKAVPYDERLLAEARRAAVCSDHPHVATIHNVLQEKVGEHDLGVLVMEYVAGTPASQLLDEGPVDVGRVLTWGRQIAAAVAHAHEHQVLHCDLKPENIVITSDGRAKVLDFGISRATFDAGDSKEPVRGTMPYMAPEQLLSKQFLPAGDIYSLGVTLFELVTGRLPFEGDDDLLRLRIVGAPPPDASDLNADVPPELQKVLERAMAKQPEKRFRSARSFERALAAAEEGVHYKTTQIVTVPRTGAAALSLVRKIAVAAGVLLAVLLGLVVLGALTSALFNVKLGRTEFAEEGIRDWLVWGRRTSIPTFVILLMIAIPSVVIRLIWQLTTRLSTGANAVDARVRQHFRELGSRLALDEPAVSTWPLLISILALVWALLWFRDLLPALVAYAGDGSVEHLALLSPDSVFIHNRYRWVMSIVVLVSVGAWYHALRNQGSSRVSLPAGALVTAAALIMLHAPYRTMFAEFAGDAFDAVQWNGSYCYVIGQRPGDQLLLCPELEAPRHRVVPAGDPSVISLQVRESVFRGFARQASKVSSQKSQPTTN